MNIEAVATANAFFDGKHRAAQNSDGIHGGVDGIDQLVAEEGTFAFDASQIDELRLSLIRKAVEWHMRPGSQYAEFANRQGFRLDVLRSTSDLARVPLLPSMLFKREGLVIKHPTASGILWTTSSGTKGSVSRVPRDDVTLRRFFASIGNLSNEMLNIENSDIEVFNLGPDADEARNLWVSYVMSGVGVLLPRSNYYVRNDEFKIEELIVDLKAGANERISVIGPPPMLLELANILTTRGIVLQPRNDSLLVAIGGWKRRSGERVPRAEFDAALMRAFRLPNSQIRDTFNMVELNTVLIECSHKHLHIPPWLYVRARHPLSLEALPSGESGVLSYLDPTALSYPGFVLSDDIGVVKEDCACSCGRRSDVLHIERRLNTMESRGCALKMDAYTKS